VLHILDIIIPSKTKDIIIINNSKAM